VIRFRYLLAALACLAVAFPHAAAVLVRWGAAHPALPFTAAAVVLALLAVPDAGRALRRLISRSA
jgi:hypothetical protein